MSSSPLALPRSIVARRVLPGSMSDLRPLRPSTRLPVSRSAARAFRRRIPPSPARPSGLEVRLSRLLIQGRR